MLHAKSQCSAKLTCITVSRLMASDSWSNNRHMDSKGTELSSGVFVFVKSLTMYVHGYIHIKHLILVILGTN